MDAILDLSDPEHPKEPEWPEAEFIVGNPPFLGGKLLRTNLGDDYVEAMFASLGRAGCRERRTCAATGSRRPGGKSRPANADALACWPRRASAAAQTARCWSRSRRRATSSSPRATGTGFSTGRTSMCRWSASMTARRGGRILDGKAVSCINANLRATADTTTAKPLGANQGLSFMGDTKGGAFDIPEAVAMEMLRAPNPHGRPNSDVLVPWINGLDLTRRPRGMWIIDFGVDMPQEKAARYEQPFAHVERHVQPEREKNKRQAYRERWWIHVEARPAMRRCIAGVLRFIGTVRVSKYRLFCRIDTPNSAGLPGLRLSALR